MTFSKRVSFVMNKNTRRRLFRKRNVDHDRNWIKLYYFLTLEILLFLHVMSAKVSVGSYGYPFEILVQIYMCRLETLPDLWLLFQFPSDTYGQIFAIISVPFRKVWVNFHYMSALGMYLIGLSDLWVYIEACSSSMQQHLWVYFGQSCQIYGFFLQWITRLNNIYVMHVIFEKAV